MFPVTRRTALAAALGVVATGCGRHRAVGYAGYAIIAASGDKALSVVDLLSFNLEKQIALNAEPTKILATPNGHMYALTPKTGSVHVLSPDLQLAGTYGLAASVSDIGLSPNARRLLAIAPSSNELIVADAGSLKVLHRQKVGADPKHLAISAPGFAAVATGSGSVHLLDLRSGAVQARQMNGAVGKVCFRQDGQLLLVANLSDRVLSGLSVPGLELVAELPLAMRPQNLCFSGDGGQLFVSGEGMDGVAIIFPYKMLQVDQTVLAGRDPGVMAASDNPSYLFVGSASGTDICILRIENRRMIGLVDVAQRPGFIAVTPDNQYALVLNEASGDMAVIHISAIRQNGVANRYKSGASLFTILSVGQRPVHAVIVPRQV